ncbi:hypothetical protein [Erythrobacter sp. YT30]|uniref:hypothetical protein n=1 Tax=Erythrobacter sp. YT30 TaxID=1735012 RepID=UPI00076BD9A0|nr:hypothetical protein [Erythrobacter sp. YT30]KWV91817.1 hypothetical protein AUC45_11515 [Erythrobacter sp. YT30]
MIEALLMLAMQGEPAGQLEQDVSPDLSAEEQIEQAGELAEAPDPPASVPPPPVKPIIDIPRDTPVRLMVLTEVSTKDHQPGHRFRLRVNEPVLVDGREVIPVGAFAWGELLSAEKSGNVGKSGKLSARLLYIEYDGLEIPLDGETQSEGKSGKGETILGVLAAGPLGLFAKGNNAKLKAGEKMTAFIAEDVSFGGDDPVEPVAGAQAQIETASAPISAEQAVAN